jgi:hypothetical protein
MAAEDRLERLDAILGTVNAGYESHARMLAKAQLQEEAFIKKMAKLNNESVEATTAKLKLMTSEIAASKKREQHEEQREKAIVDGIKKTISGLQQFAGGAVSASQSIYNSDSAFTAVIPTLNLLGDTVKNITSALSSFTSGIPILGGIVEGINKVTAVGVDLTMKVMSAALENAQKVVNEYNNVSKTGMTFGASLEKMQQAAQAGGMSLSTYSKFVTGNIENLSSMGGSLEVAAAKVTEMSSRIAKSNAGLLTIYGGFGELAAATAEYQSTMARYGVDINKNDKDLTAGAQAYLINMKELSSMTGKNAASLKKEEEARQKSAAYQMALARMPEEERENVKRTITITNEMFGQLAADYAQEFVSTKGQITSRTGQMFQNFQPAIAETVRMQLAATKLSEGFNREQAKIIQGRKDINKEDVERNESLLINQAGALKGNPVAEILNTTGASVLASQTAQANMIKTVEEQDKSRKAIAAADKSGKTAVSGVLTDVEKFKIGIDKATASTENLNKLGTVVEQLLKIQERINSAFGTESAFKDAGVKFVDFIDKLLDKLGPRVDGRTNDKVAAGADVIPGMSSDGMPDQSKAHLTALEDNTNALRDNNTSLGAWFTDLMRRNEQGRPGGAPVSGPLVPAAQPTPAPAPAAAPTGTTVPVSQSGMPPKLKAPVKPGAGNFSPEVILALNAIYEQFGAQGMEVTSGQDPFHKNRKNSPHNAGLAADMKFRKGSPNYKLLEDQINQMLKEKGIDAKYETHYDEDKQGNKLSGQHGHVQVKPAQKKAEADVLEQILAVMTDIRDVNVETKDINTDQHDLLYRLNRTMEYTA